MMLYLDDDSASLLLAQLLGRAGHDVRRPVEVSMVGKDDSVHLAYAIGTGRILISHNHRDFENLHNLLMVAHGHHPGILLIRQDNNPKRDLKAPGIVRAIAKLEAAGVQLADHLYILNHWR